jgi:molybdopterin-containing oxidoreductase family iron-sulfur binding subunit
MSNPTFDLDALRERLAKATGKQYWRSLDELADNEEFHSFLDREFPRQAQALDSGIDRRTFMKLMGASLALAGLSGCQFALRQPEQKVVPYVRLPEGVIPGKPLFYATSMSQGGFGYGIVAETHEGRPTKLEGNPSHPATLGASNVYLQAHVLQMYDPDRSQKVRNKNAEVAFDAFAQAIAQVMTAKRGNQGVGLRFLTETVTSPTLATQMQTVLQQLPQARWVQYDAVNYGNERAGAIAAFGEYVNTIYDIAKADVIVALDADFMGEGPAQIRYAREYASRHRAAKDLSKMNRMYVAEPTPTFTGIAAEHRLQARSAQIEAIARGIAQALGVQGVAAATGPALNDKQQRWVAAVAKDLQGKRGLSVVMTGPAQPPAVHAIVHAINQTLGNVDQTVRYTEPVEANHQDQIGELRRLVEEINAGSVDTLIIVGGNPVYNAPADVRFGEALAKVANSVHLSLYNDETSQVSAWHVPAQHELELWGDVRAFDGTTSIIQPMIAPIYPDTRSAIELVALLAGTPDNSYNLVRATWQARLQANFEAQWPALLRDGVVPNSASAAKQVTLRSGFDQPSPAAAEGYELVIRPDGTVGDGRWANLGWLQELAKPMTKLTWDNAVLVSPKTAQKLGVQGSQIVEISAGEFKTKGPIWILPGQTEDVITVHLGYGRTQGGKIASATTGFNAYTIRTAANQWFASGVTVNRTTDPQQLMVTTQDHNSMEGRGFIREGTLAEYTENPEFLKEVKEDITLYPRLKWEGVQWGMTIDLNACIGCGVCTIACQAENNIAVVGKDQVWKGREMSWIRIDRYFEGADIDNPNVLHQPLPCMQCENAPCESVCPVAATVHTADGINSMVYNRCVGTRYCSNNCPFKVRRYNFLGYSLIPLEVNTSPEINPDPEVLHLVRNPNVTVRSRGVMEKCSFCSQRIANARQDAERQGIALKDGDVITACQQACPTQAIAFGNINDPESQVAKLKAEKLNYTLLDKLNVKARVSYLGRVRNVNPELAEA